MPVIDDAPTIEADLPQAEIEPTDAPDVPITDDAPASEDGPEEMPLMRAALKTAEDKLMEDIAAAMSEPSSTLKLGAMAEEPTSESSTEIEVPPEPPSAMEPEPVVDANELGSSSDADDRPLLVAEPPTDLGVMPTIEEPQPLPLDLAPEVALEEEPTEDATLPAPPVAPSTEEEPLVQEGGPIIEEEPTEDVPLPAPPVAPSIEGEPIGQEGEPIIEATAGPGPTLDVPLDDAVVEDSMAASPPEEPPPEDDPDIEDGALVPSGPGQAVALPETEVDDDLQSAEDAQKEKTMNIRERFLSRKKDAEAGQAKGGSFLLTLMTLSLLVVAILCLLQLRRLTARLEAMEMSGANAGAVAEVPTYEYAIDFLRDKEISAGMEARGQGGWQVVGSRRTQDRDTADLGYEFIFMRPAPQTDTRD